MHQLQFSQAIVPAAWLASIALCVIANDINAQKCPSNGVEENEPCGSDYNGSCQPTGLCEGPSGSCCAPGESPGCEDPVCQQNICAFDPFCCDTAWDGICAAAACSDDLNCQCDYVPYPNIACGDTICGTLWAEANFRDVDFFKFETSGGRIEWAIESDWPSQCFILDGQCPPRILAAGVPCGGGIRAAAILPPGKYHAFVATLDFDGLPCDSGMNGYLATLTCTPCFADATGDGTVAVDDLQLIINGWGECAAQTCDSQCVPDVNGDLVVDVDDLLAVINNWGDC